MIIESDNITITTKYTGHMYNNSEIETSSSCANCDGANCETCQQVHVVSNLDVTICKFNDLQNAKLFKQDLIMVGNNPMPDIRTLFRNKGIKCRTSFDIDAVKYTSTKVNDNYYETMYKITTVINIIIFSNDTPYKLQLPLIKTYLRYDELKDAIISSGIDMNVDELISVMYGNKQK